jgi:hypothetical protein
MVTLRIGTKTRFTSRLSRSLIRFALIFKTLPLKDRLTRFGPLESPFKIPVVSFPTSEACCAAAAGTRTITKTWR